MLNLQNQYILVVLGNQKPLAFQIYFFDYTNQVGCSVLEKHSNLILAS